MRVLALRAQNFRTLDDFEVSFPPGYAAICGANNAGKSNIVRALSILFENKHGPAGFQTQAGFDYVRDLPTWADGHDTRKPEISLECDIEFSKDDDFGLFTFLQRYLSINRQTGTLSLTLKKKALRRRKTWTEVILEGRRLTRIEVAEVMRRFIGAGPLVLYNSVLGGLEYARLYGNDFMSVDVNRERTGAAIDDLDKYMQDKIAELAESQLEKIRSLLHLFESALTVQLSIPRFSFDEFPFDVALGFGGSKTVPLELWGAGTRNQLAILLTLHRASQQKYVGDDSEKFTPIVVIEEPECYLHPPAQASFGKALQSIVESLGVQVLATTHSPFMLSRRSAPGIIWLSRAQGQNGSGGSRVYDASGDDWALPFARILGLDESLISPWRDVVFDACDAVILVEGVIDEAYLKTLQNPLHGENALSHRFSIMSYGGAGQLHNGSFLAFLQRYLRRLIITCDLDQEGKVRDKLTKLGVDASRDFIPVGRDETALRAIEGLLPEWVRNSVYSENLELVNKLALGEQEKEEAKAELKSLMLKKFSAEAKPGEDFVHFYDLSKRLNALIAVTDTAVGTMPAALPSVPEPVRRPRRRRRRQASRA